MSAGQDFEQKVPKCLRLTGQLTLWLISGQSSLELPFLALSSSGTSLEQGELTWAATGQGPSHPLSCWAFHKHRFECLKVRNGCPHAHEKHTHRETLLSENPQGLLVTSHQLSYICMKVRTQELPGAGSPALPLTVGNAGSLPPQPGARWVCVCTHVSYFGMWATVEKEAKELSLLSPESQTDTQLTG